MTGGGGGRFDRSAEDVNYRKRKSIYRRVTCRGPEHALVHSQRELAADVGLQEARHLSLCPHLVLDLGPVQHIMQTDH